MDPVSQLSQTSQQMSEMSKVNDCLNNSRNDEKVRQKSLIDSMVVLLNSNESNYDYIQEIQWKCTSNTIEFIEMSPIIFNYINSEPLFEALLAVDNWSAICLTSKRCVDAIRLALNCGPNSNVIDLWHKSNKRVFVVGIKSYEYLMTTLGWEAIGSQCGNSDNLAQLMINEYKHELSAKPVLYPCSQSRSDYLPQTLSNAGIVVNEIAVYETLPNSQLSSKVNQLSNRLIDCLKDRVSDVLKLILIFFSPSGFQSFNPILDEYILQNQSLRHKLEIKYVAIGDTTGAALRRSSINKPEVKSPLRLKLESWLNKNMRILMSDGRTLVGIFLCTDRDRNVILGSCVEYLKPNEDGNTEEPRLLGLAMIPGQHIMSIHIDKTHLPLN